MSKAKAAYSTRCHLYVSVGQSSFFKGSFRLLLPPPKNG